MTVRRYAYCLLALGVLLLVSGNASAETRTVSWDPVTTYTDNTVIEAGKTVTYTMSWSTDPALSLASLHQIASGLTTTSTTFDPGLQGMTRGGTVYFTGKTVLSTGEESALSPAFSWVVPIVTTPTLSSIAVSGATSVNEGTTATYTATATWSDNTTSAVTPTWSVTTTYATISTAGLLTAATVSATQTVTVSASYTSGSVTRTASRSVSIVNVPSSSPASPGNMQISGPVTISPSETWQLSWDSVSTYLGGAVLEASRPVRYTAYWTRDPTLAVGTLHPLATSISATSVVFSPAASAMVNNERVYFAAVAVLSDTGDPSPLSASLSWVVSNQGPFAPAGGSIIAR
jgi:hypothetical protein